MKLSNRLKIEALILFKNSPLEGREAFNLIHKRVKDAYYKLNLKEKLACNEEWKREDERRESESNTPI